MSQYPDVTVQWNGGSNEINHCIHNTRYVPCTMHMVCPPLFYCGYIVSSSGYIWSPELRYMMTSSNGNILRVTSLCAENSPVTGEFSSQWPVTRSLDVF